MIGVSAPLKEKPFSHSERSHPNSHCHLSFAELQRIMAGLGVYAFSLKDNQNVLAILFHIKVPNAFCSTEPHSYFSHS